MSQAHIFQINASDGGVPKLPLTSVQVTADGLACDAQTHTDVHGGPERAVCLFALERILALQAEGHPIFPGATGENLTVAGLDWDQVAPGAVLRLGDQVVLEVASFTTPCGTIAGAFGAGGPGRISQKKHPGWSRVYARVLQGGEITVGDRVVLEC